MLGFYNFWFICFFLCMIGCMLYRKHLLSVFISLEVLSVLLSWGMIIWASVYGYGFFFVMFFFVFSVCEACVGLGLLVNYVRIFGYDSCLIMNSLD